MVSDVEVKKPRLRWGGSHPSTLLCTLQHATDLAQVTSSWSSCPSGPPTRGQFPEHLSALRPERDTSRTLKAEDTGISVVQVRRNPGPRQPAGRGDF
jgi:hypothetical protein